MTLSQSSTEQNAGRFSENGDRFIRIEVKDGDCFSDSTGRVYMARWRKESGRNNLKLESDSGTLTLGNFQHVFDALGLTRCKT